MSQINKDISKLKESDILNIILYGIYKLSGNQRYSTLSELIYVLDKDSLYKLCSVFGGITIRVPTLNELELLVNVLLIYQYINIEKKSLDEACELVGVKKSKDLVLLYNELVKILNEYIQTKINNN